MSPFRLSIFPFIPATLFPTIVKELLLYFDLDLLFYCLWASGFLVSSSWRERKRRKIWSVEEESWS
jgi:hypothetical protein